MWISTLLFIHDWWASYQAWFHGIVISDKKVSNFFLDKKKISTAEYFSYFTKQQEQLCLLCGLPAKENGGRPGIYTTKILWAQNRKLVAILLFYAKVMTRTGHNFANVTTSQLSWHMQICDLIKISQEKLEQNKLSQDFRSWPFCWGERCYNVFDYHKLLLWNGNLTAQFTNIVYFPCFI